MNPVNYLSNIEQEIANRVSTLSYIQQKNLSIERMCKKTFIPYKKRFIKTQFNSNIDFEVKEICNELISHQATYFDVTLTDHKDNGENNWGDFCYLTITAISF